MPNFVLLWFQVFVSLIPTLALHVYIRLVISETRGKLSIISAPVLYTRPPCLQWHPEMLLTYAQARDYCIADGGRLAKPDAALTAYINARGPLA